MGELKGWYKRGNFPHYDQDYLYQFITFRLFDSVPEELVLQWKEELEQLNEKQGHISEKYFIQKRLLKYEDAGHGECILKIPEVYKIVENVLFFYDNKKYELVEWKIMPNHVHVLIYIYKNVNLHSIIHSWKSYSANQINKCLGRKGKVWMNDYFDRYIRDMRHFNRVVEYIRNN